MCVNLVEAVIGGYHPVHAEDVSTLAGRVVANTCTAYLRKFDVVGVVVSGVKGGFGRIGKVVKHRTRRSNARYGLLPVR